MSDALPPPPSPRSDQVLQYTHSGSRYLLGYGPAFFGIWDRGGPVAPLERFPRTVEGWHRAWLRYVSLEPTNAEVALGPASVPTAVVPEASTTPTPGASSRRVNPAWWLLPILMGWMGGLIAWLVTKEDDPGRARAMLVAGIVATVFWIAIYSVVLPPPA